MILFFRFCFEAAGKRCFGGRDTYFCQAVVMTFDAGGAHNFYWVSIVQYYSALLWLWWGGSGCHKENSHHAGFSITSGESLSLNLWRGTDVVGLISTLHCMISD
jgi:hypothetical protein